MENRSVPKQLLCVCLFLLSLAQLRRGVANRVRTGAVKRAVKRKGLRRDGPRVLSTALESARIQDARRNLESEEDREHRQRIPFAHPLLFLLHRRRRHLSCYTMLGDPPQSGLPTGFGSVIVPLRVTFYFFGPDPIVFDPGPAVTLSIIRLRPCIKMPSSPNGFGQFGEMMQDVQPSGTKWIRERSE